MVGRHEPVVAEEHFDVGPVERARREVLVARSRGVAARQRDGSRRVGDDEVGEVGRDVFDDAELSGQGHRPQSAPGAPTRVRDAPDRWTAETVDVYETNARTSGSRQRQRPVPASPRAVRRPHAAGRPGRSRFRPGLVQRACWASRWSRWTPRSRWSQRVADVRAGRAAGRRATSSTCRSGGARSRARGRTSPTCTCRHARVPMALAELHRAVALGGAVHLQVTCDQVPAAGGRSVRRPALLALHDRTVPRARRGARASTCCRAADDGEEWIDVEATRGPHARPTRSAPTCGCWSSASTRASSRPTSGIGFARPGNRFWPAAHRGRARAHDALDPFHALPPRRRRHDEPRAAPDGAAPSELTRDEYRAGAARLERLVAWLQPRAVCFVGLTGYRAAVDRAGDGSAGRTDASRRRARLRHAEHERPERARQARRLRRALPRACRHPRRSA